MKLTNEEDLGVGDLQVQESASPPDFDFGDLIREAVNESQKAGKSPVRYLSLGGDKPRTRTGMAWNPSSLDGCSLKAVYKAVGVRQEQTSVDYDTQFIFDRGTVMGAWLASYIRALEGTNGITDVEAQVIDRDEMLVKDENLSYGGFIDISFKKDGKPYLVEVKSKDNETALNKISSPDPKHSRQLNDYFAMSGVHQGWVVYMGMIEGGRGQRFSLRSFGTALSPAMWNKTVGAIQSLDRFRQRPERMPFKSDNPRFECPGCPFRSKCHANMTPQQALVSE